MKYMLLIHQGDTPTPRDPDAWGRLSEDEQKAVFAAYGEVNQTAGVTPGEQMDAPEAGDHGARAGRQDADDGRAVRRGQGGARRLPVLRGGRPGRRDRAGARRSRPRSIGGAIEVRPVVEGY